MGQISCARQCQTALAFPDGYIVDANGFFDWIKGQDDSMVQEDMFTPFFASIDAVIMGKRTYDQISPKYHAPELRHVPNFS